jgi:hypothetical protein
MSQNSAHYNQRNHSPTQKMPMAFFVRLPGNRQFAECCKEIKQILYTNKVKEKQNED